MRLSTFLSTISRPKKILTDFKSNHPELEKLVLRTIGIFGLMDTMSLKICGKILNCLMSNSNFIAIIQTQTNTSKVILDSKSVFNVPVKVLSRNLLPLEVAHALS